MCVNDKYNGLRAPMWFHDRVDITLDAIAQVHIN